MKNFVSNGESLQLIAPAGGVVGGQLYRQVGIVGVVVADAAEGEQFTLKIKGNYDTLTKIAGEAWAIGDPVYMKADNSGLTTTALNNFLAGYATATALAGDIVGSAVLK